MANSTGRLADLHLHMYGSIHYLDYLDFVSRRDVDWSAYETGFEDAYGEHPPIRDVLERCNQGDPGAVEEFRRLFVFGDRDGGDFRRFQAKYDLLLNGSEFSKLLRGEASFASVVDELCGIIHKVIARQREQNVGYAEQRMLLNHAFTRPQAKGAIAAVLESYSNYEDSNIQPRFAVILPRDDPWPDWEVVRETATGPYGKWLTGIDFCNVEEGHPPKEKRELFDEVKSFNRRHPDRALAILYHVGESFNDKSLESAVRWVHEAAEMGAHRLGHAIALGVDPEMYGPHTRGESIGERIDQLRYDLRHRDGLRLHGVHIDVNAVEMELRRLHISDKHRPLETEYDDRKLREVRLRQKYAIECVKSLGSFIEVCPTSNRRIAGITDTKHHPLVQFAASDVPFVVGTDDPGIFDTTLEEEIRSAIDIVKGQTLGSYQVHQDNRDSNVREQQGLYDAIVARSWASRSEVLSGRELHKISNAPRGTT